MKKLYSLIIFSTILVSLQAQPIMNPVPDTIDYGCILQNSDPNREFVYFNTGDMPLIIINARGASGAVIPIWPKEALAPGDSATFMIRYNTSRLGKFNKSITITTNEGANQDSSHSFNIIGEVKLNTKTKEEAAQAIAIFPTISSNVLNISPIQSDKAVNVDLEVWHPNGQRILFDTDMHLSTSTQLDISSLSSGWYIIRLSIDGKDVMIKKFMKL